MAIPHQVLNKIRHKIRGVVGNQVEIEDYFFSFDRDTGQIVSNRKIGGWHFIFDLEGNELEYKRHQD